MNSIINIGHETHGITFFLDIQQKPLIT